MSAPTIIRPFALLVLLSGAAATAHGQAPLVTSLETIGNDQEDRARVAQILGDSSAAGYLIRSPSSRAPALAGGSRFRWAIVAPEVQFIGNSLVPFSLNDGALWAARGWNYAVTAGVRADWGPVRLILAPQYGYSRNGDSIQPNPIRSQPIPPGRSPFSSPWHTIPSSADLPLRFGGTSYRWLDPGQSSLSVEAGPITTGIATENQWWGPGIRNAIVMSNNAGGIPHFFLRSTRPLGTPIGWFEWKWMVGGLSESKYFDTVSTNNLRSLASMAVSWQPKPASGLSLGLTRSVFAPATGWGQLPLRMLNVFALTGRPNARPVTDSTMIPGRDQVFSLFARWVFPKEGFETYFEWSRTELPVSLRDLLTAPDHTQGSTFGLQWAKPTAPDRRGIVRLQTEVTYLAQSTTYRDRPTGSYYASRAVIQGYTQRGQVIGASIGPGSSSQWLAVDYLARGWSAGLFLGRIRWDDDALYELTVGPPALCSHDVSLFGGARGGYRGRFGRITAELSAGTRYNMYYRHFFLCGEPDTAMYHLDVKNTQLVLRFSPFR